jgi:hypothetical protein
MLARTDFWDNREFGHEKNSSLLDALMNPDFLAVCVFAALGLFITICLVLAFPLNEGTISLITQLD